MVMAHSFSLTRHDGLAAYAERFAAAGAAVLVFDHRYLGDSARRAAPAPPQARAARDWRAAVAFARQTEGIDPQQISFVGFSFGRSHAMRTTAADPRVAATIALCPFADGLARALSTPPRLSAWLLPRALADQCGRHNLVPVTAQPGERGAMTLLQVRQMAFARSCRTTRRGATDLARRKPHPLAASPACARSTTPTLRYGWAWASTTCRFPTARIERPRRRAPRAELHRYPYDHFGAFLGDAPEQIAADQVDFLRRHGLLRSTRSVNRGDPGTQGARDALPTPVSSGVQVTALATTRQPSHPGGLQCKVRVSINRAFRSSDPGGHDGDGWARHRERGTHRL